MSSRSKKAKDLGGSHPPELRREHRQFLVRSVDRNDVDLAALFKLNRSLHKARAQILESCGELVLLDLGVGRLTLVNDELHLEKKQQQQTPVVAPSSPAAAVDVVAKEGEDPAAAETTTPPATTTDTAKDETDQEDEEEYTLTPAQKEMCVDFLLRMKLRRKLLNRLSRRLNRTAQAMDGSEVNPPPPPRYGDLRLHMDPSAVQGQSMHRERQALARRRIAQAKAGGGGGGVVVAEEEPPSKESATAAPTATATAPDEPVTSTSSVPAEEKLDSKEAPKESTTTATAEEKEEPKEAPKEISAAAIAAAVETKASEGIKPEGPTSEETKAPEEPKPEGTTTAEETKAPEEPKPEGATSEEAPTNKAVAAEEPTPMEVDKEPDASSSIANDPPAPPTNDPPAPPTNDPPAPPTNDPPAPPTVSSDAPAAETPALTASTTTETPAAAAPSGPDTVESTVEKMTSSSTTPQEEPPTLQEEYNIVREFEEAYEKVWDKESKTFKYVIASQEVAPDYTSIKAGAAIGAQSRLLSEQEREQEHKRWQTALLSRIPQQPTFEDLGLKNRVFCLEARRKRCVEEADEEDNEEEEGPATKKRKESESGEEEKDTKDGDDETSEKEAEKKDGDDSSDMFEDDGKDEEVKKDAGDTKDEDDSSDMFEDENKSDEKYVSAEKKEEEKPEVEQKKIKLEPRKKKEEEEKPEEPVEKPKIIKPMSLAAVPSFYEQDLHRIRLVHGDLLGSSIMEHARRQMADATNEYNAAHRNSNQIYEHRTRLQQNLAYFMARSKTELTKINSDHVLQVAIAKQQWFRQKQEHDKKRCQQFIPSNWGRAPFGTTATQNYQRRGGVAGVVASCMADVVDGVIIMMEDKIPNKKFDNFVPPRPQANQQTGETLAQQHARMESQLKRQMNEVTVKLQASEEDRQRAWTKMMKTKAEMDPTPSMFPGRRGVRIDITNFHQVPLPQLRHSAPQAIPQQFGVRAAVASYRPPSNVNATDSKYSPASVRERISSDGTVRTVQEPKKTNDGLYMRPAGRTRKGMQWDAVRGIWVPEGSQ